MTEKILSQISEFVDELKLVDHKSDQLKLFAAILKRCMTPDAKQKSAKQTVNPEKIICAFKDYLQVHLTFLENEATLKLLPRDQVISYDSNKKIAVPLGAIIANCKGSLPFLKSIRKHLIVIAAITGVSPKEKVKNLLDQILGAEVPIDPATQLDEEDLKFMKSLPSIPGVDQSVMASIINAGKESFGDIDPGENLSDEQMFDKLKQGITGILDNPALRNVISSLNQKASNGEINESDLASMMALGQSMVGSFINGGEGAGQLPSQ
jgi:hypothetical protein